jgi:thiol-disulfide isomerase/thioredoxin
MRLFVIALGAFGVITAVFAAELYRGTAPSPSGYVTSKKTAGSPDEAANLLIKPQDAKPAPELADGVWVNSKPLSIKALRGQVVLVDFWTFACYNCRNTLPSLKQWDRKYREQGLTIVGVHSPEQEHEKSLDNLRKAVLSLGIAYPVVTDNDYNSWNAYGVQAWPTQVLVDKQGRIRWMHVGEGSYAEAEAAIRELLAE